MSAPKLRPAIRIRFSECSITRCAVKPRKAKAGRRSGRKALAWLMVLSLLPALCQARETAAFLKLQPAARPMAMAEAFTAVADDLAALTTNPSGLARLGSRQAGFMHAQLYEQTSYDFAGYAQAVSGDSILPAGTFGVGVQRVSYGSLEGRDENRQPTGGFGAADTAVSLAFARRLGDEGWKGGVGVKFIDSRLANASARGVAVDLGVTRPAHIRSLALDLGLAAQNLGPGLRYGDETERLPLAVSFGAGLHLGPAMLLAADLRARPYGEGLGFCVGTEYAVLGALALRAGYASLSGPSNTSPLGGLAMGFGVKVLRASLDYSFTPHGELGNAQRISLSTKF